MTVPAERVPRPVADCPGPPGTRPRPAHGLDVEVVWHPGMDLDTFDRLVLLLCSPAPSGACDGGDDRPGDGR